MPGGFGGGTEFVLVDRDGKALDLVTVNGINKIAVSMEAGAPEENGVPFSKVSYATELKNLNKGSKNKITVRPRVLIENMNTDTNSVEELGVASVTDVGQIFRLTTGIMDIDRIHLTLEASAGAGFTAIDDFESYADTTAMRAVWVPNDIVNTPNTLETSIVAEGSQAMKCDMLSKQKSKNDEFKKTFAASQDWSNDNGVQMQFRREAASSTIEFQIIDSAGDGSKQIITTSGTGAFELIQLDFNDFVPIGANPVDLTDVKELKFFIKLAEVSTFYIDKMELFTSAAFGTVDVELHDFGTDPSPTQLVTPTQTETITLGSGKKTYEIPFNVSGLTEDNYFGIVITNASVSTVKVYGKNGSDLYSSGFSFSSTNDLDITGTGAGDDLFFEVFAIDKAIFNGISFNANADTGDGKVSVFINDNASGKGKTALFIGETFLGRTQVTFPTQEQTLVTPRLFKDDLVFIDYEDDGASSVTKLQATVFYSFIDRDVHG